MILAQLGHGGRTCVACRYFDAKDGLCRFNAPTVVGWPSTRETDWCGEFAVARTQVQAGEEEICEDIPTLAASDDVTHRIRVAGGRR